MASERNRILNLIEYIQSYGITVNIGKNKAQGNKGFFKVTNKEKYRIDIAKGLDEISILSCLVHEFSHFIHYKYDNTLKNLDFILDSKNDTFIEELLNLTVETIPKENVKPIFDEKNNLQNQINILSKKIKNKYPDFKPSEKLNHLENIINKTPYKYLLKHDIVKIVDLFSTKIYSLDNLKQIVPNVDDCIIDYLNLRSKQRKLKRINNKISKLNKYYNSTTELFARSIELFICNKEIAKTFAPNLTNHYENVIKMNKIPMLNDVVNIYTQKLYF